MRERQDIKGARNQRARERRAGNQNEIRGDDCKQQANQENELRENEIKEAGAETQIMEQATSKQTKSLTSQRAKSSREKTEIKKPGRTTSSLKGVTTRENRGEVISDM